MTARHHDVVVIGAGQAGLAVGRHLAGRGRDFTILDAATAPAAAWRARWDSLRLFTPARYCGLPGMPFPAAPDHHPTRDEVVAYLTAYARNLPVECDSAVRRLRATGGGYELELGDRQVTADHVVVATGPFSTPHVPLLAARLAAEVRQLHSTDYRNPAQLGPGRVLVVGGGNTGHQIAMELAGTHEVHLAVGARQRPLPQRVLGVDVFRLLDAAGAFTRPADTPIGRRMRLGDLLIGSSPRRARRHGVHLRPRATGAAGARVDFADGSSVEVATVIWATGFGVDHAWIDAPVFGDDGTLVHRRGVTPSPGLYVVGLPWLHTRGSALLGWVGRDAAHIVDHIHHAATPPRR